MITKLALNVLVPEVNKFNIDEQKGSHTSQHGFMVDGHTHNTVFDFAGARFRKAGTVLVFDDLGI